MTIQDLINKGIVKLPVRVDEDDAIVDADGGVLMEDPGHYYFDHSEGYIIAQAFVDAFNEKYGEQK